MKTTYLLTKKKPACDNTANYYNCTYVPSCRLSRPDLYRYYGTPTHVVIRNRRYIIITLGGTNIMRTALIHTTSPSLPCFFRSAVHKIKSSRVFYSSCSVASKQNSRSLLALFHSLVGFSLILRRGWY
jgi:hypothetical protein